MLKRDKLIIKRFDPISKDFKQNIIIDIVERYWEKVPHYQEIFTFRDEDKKSPNPILLKNRRAIKLYERIH